MKNEGKILELLADMALKQDHMVEEFRNMKEDLRNVKEDLGNVKSEISKINTEMVKLNLQTSEIHVLSLSYQIRWSSSPTSATG